jgi:hypothetical protein
VPDLSTHWWANFRGVRPYTPKFLMRYLHLRGKRYTLGRGTRRGAVTVENGNKCPTPGAIEEMAGTEALPRALRAYVTHRS